MNTNATLTRPAEETRATPAASPAAEDPRIPPVPVMQSAPQPIESAGTSPYRVVLSCSLDLRRD